MLQYRTYIIGGDEKSDMGGYIELLLEIAKGLPMDFDDTGVKFGNFKQSPLPALSQIGTVSPLDPESRSRIRTFEDQYWLKTAVRVPCELYFGEVSYLGNENRFEENGEPPHQLCLADPQHLGRIIKAFSKGNEQFLNFLVDKWGSNDQRAMGEQQQNLYRLVSQLDTNSYDRFWAGMEEVRKAAFLIPELRRDETPRLVTCEMEGPDPEFFSSRNQVRTMLIAFHPEKAEKVARNIREAREIEQAHPPLSGSRALEPAKRSLANITREDDRNQSAGSVSNQPVTNR
jgi:hypothetical protein